MLEYVKKLGNVSALKRFGFLLELVGNPFSEKVLRSIRNKGKGYSKLDPILGPKGKYSYKWKLLINVDEKTLKGDVRAY